jgi:hypothetical protein
LLANGAEMRMNLRDSCRTRRHDTEKFGLDRRESRQRRRSGALRVRTRRIRLGVMMPRVIVTQVMMMAEVCRFRIAYDDSQPSVDGSEHEARGNKGAEA